MSMCRFRRTTKVLVVAVVAALIGVTNPYGGATAATALIHACKTNATGVARLVDGPSACKANEIAVSWNQEGPIGPKGDDGEDGNDGTDGTDGTFWFTGAGGPPGEQLGAAYDLYLDSNTGEVYRKIPPLPGQEFPGWQVIAQIKGPSGSDGDDGEDGARWHSREGAPGPDDGLPGDFYLDALTGFVYEMNGAGDWRYQASIKGADGDKWVTGKGPPGPFFFFNPVGTLYLDTVSGDVYEQVKVGDTGREAEKIANIKGPPGLISPRHVEHSNVFEPESKNYVETIARCDYVNGEVAISGGYGVSGWTSKYPPPVFANHPWMLQGKAIGWFTQATYNPDVVQQDHAWTLTAYALCAKVSE